MLPDTEGVRSLLRDLERGDGLGTLPPDAGLALDVLLEGGLLVERSVVLTAGHDRSGSTTAAVAAHGPGASARMSARRTCRVALHAAEPWGSVAAERVGSAGLTLVPPGSPRTVTLVVTAGEPRRSLVDQLVREDRPHLLLALYADRARLGPFVVPGATACLRCLDAHLGEMDPRRALVIEQIEESATVVPCDPVLSHAALALAVLDVVSFAEGDRPPTWSATMTLSAALGQPVRSWPRHPHCGCSWG